MRVSQIRDQIQELGEIMYNKEMTTIMLNALPNEWGNFVSRIYERRNPIHSMNFGHYVKMKKLG